MAAVIYTKAIGELRRAYKKQEAINTKTLCCLPMQAVHSTVNRSMSQPEYPTPRKKHGKKQKL